MASVEVHVRVADWPATIDCVGGLNVTVGSALDGVCGAGVVLPVLLPPLPHALKKRTTPTRTAASNIENFCPMGLPRG